MKEKATWWTLEGFIKNDAPEAYTAIAFDQEWEKAFADAGYKHVTSRFGDDINCLQIVIRKHESGHYHVNIWNDYEELSEFFVSPEDQNEFFATWYVNFLRDASIVNGHDEFRQIAKTLVAYVRHGHGEETIDQYGEMSLDDQNEMRRAQLTKK